MLKPILTAAGVLALSGATAAAQTGGGDWAGHGRHMMGYGGWGGWFMGPLMMLIFVVLLVGAIVLVVRLLGGDGGGSAGRPQHRADRSLEILRERFARGEIDSAEFEERRKALGE